MTLFAAVAAASDAAVATRSRSAKVAAFAELLAGLGRDEVAPVVAWLSGTARQGRIGVGWATVRDLEIEPATEASLSVGEVDAMFTEVGATTGSGSGAARHHLLSTTLARATAPEIDLLRRLLIGEIRQGALESLVADAVAKAAGLPVARVRRAAMLAGDLPTTATIALHEPGALDDVGLTVGVAVQPMLAASAASVADALELTGEASVEWKLDGIRVQAHKQGDDVRLYTRNLNDVTDRLPPVVAMVRRFSPGSLVLDGEAIGGSARFFDILHVDGRDVLDLPLRERIALLEASVGDAAMPRLLTADPAEAAAFADDALARGHEGVMVKAIDAPYDAGRRGGSWRKVKPVKTLDLVVLGAEWGSGRRRGWLSNLHLGARDGDGFVMVGKTFKGMTDALLTWQTEQLLARQVREEGHTVFVRPELVVEIALDGALPSTRYAGGVALRFARVRRYREDKGPEDVDTIQSVQQLANPRE